MPFGKHKGVLIEQIPIDSYDSNQNALFDYKFGLTY